MKNAYLQNLTDEERQANAARAKIARAEKKSAGELLKQDWQDENHFRKLASQYGIRLPLSYIPNSEVKYLKRTMKALGIDPKDYLAACGFTNLKQFHKENPLTPAWVECSYVIEYFDEMENSK